jgi:hypothetical protein
MTSTESNGASLADQASPDTTISSTASRFFRTLGPGLITGASDDDPSGIGAYSQAGAQLGVRRFLDNALQLSADGRDPGD